jgi:hypothetical protein
MRRKKWVCLITILGLLLFAFSACAKKDAASGNGNGTMYNSLTVGDNAASESVAPAESATMSEEPLKSTSTTTTNVTVSNSQEKIIRRASLEVETRDFDKLITSVSTQINQLGGYVESSEIRGRYYNSDNLRNGYIVARIPKDKLDQFIGNVYNMANVVNKLESTENVTLQYIDTESHKKALEIEQERLLALLEKVETLEDIITLETRLSDVRYELESYESQLRTYDNLVDYSTVTLNVQEVERFTDAVEKKTVWSRIQSGFGNTIFHIGEGFTNFIVWFVVNLPYLILWAIVITISVIIGKKYYKRSKAKSLAQQQEPMLGLKQKDNKEE